MPLLHALYARFNPPSSRRRRGAFPAASIYERRRRCRSPFSPQTVSLPNGRFSGRCEGASDVMCKSGFVISP